VIVDRGERVVNRRQRDRRRRVGEVKYYVDKFPVNLVVYHDYHADKVFYNKC
jgi:hypothetical protein